MFGQSVPASEIRSRCPGSNTHEVASSSTATSTASPGTSTSGAVDEFRCVRLSNPRVTSAEVPSGNTSHNFTDRNATGADAVTSTRNVALPRISNSSVTGQSYTSDQASSAR